MTETPTILVADDELTAQKLIAGILRSQGYHILFARDGVEALAQAGMYVPDLILLDMMMPNMDGLETCRRLRADPLLAEVPILMITAYDDREVRLDGIDAGADDFIVKPFDRDELRLRIRTILRLNRYRKLLLERNQRRQAEDELQRYVWHLEAMVSQRTAELEQERDQTRAILEAVGEAVIVSDVNGTITYANPAAERLHARAAADLVGRSWLTLLSDEQASRVRPEVMSCIKTGQSWIGEGVLEQPDGNDLDVAITITPLFDLSSPGELRGVVSVKRNITPLRAAERMKNEFVSNVSHELRTPLSVVTLLSSSLRSLYDRIGDEQRRAMIGDICVHSQLLSDLISDVLEISRIDSGRVEHEHHLLDLSSLVREEVARQQPLAEKKQLRLSDHSSESLPVFGNERQVRQIVRNLLNNAIKYTREHGAIRCEQTLVQVDTFAPGAERFDAEGPQRHWDGDLPGVERWPGMAELPAGAWVGVRVSDTGIGIAPEHLPRLFQRFSRVNVESNVPGTGLGLAIARELTRLNYGFLNVASVEGVGSCFVLYLPLHAEHG